MEDEDAQERAAFTPLWRVSEAKSLKTGTRNTVFWVKSNPKWAAFQRDGGLVGSKEPAKFVTGDSYAGGWLHNRKHGFGTQVWSSGRKYQGDWRDGKREGTGTLWRRVDGKLRKEYAGQWKNNKRHGMGVFYDAQGNKYEGNWSQGKMSGRGKLLYANGDVYEGEFLDDNRSGLGIMTFANGDRYEGHWLNGKREGEGRHFYMSTRKVLQAEWTDDAPKCGVFSDWPQDTSRPADNQAFTLPRLGLEDADEVVAEALRNTRRERAQALGAQLLRAMQDEDRESGTGASMSAIEAAFSAEELDDIVEAFASIDTLERGWVLGSDLVLVFRALEIYPEDPDAILDELGASADSEVTLREFLGLLAALRAPDDDEESHADEEEEAKEEGADHEEKQSF